MKYYAVDLLSIFCNLNDVFDTGYNNEHGFKIIDETLTPVFKFGSSIINNSWLCNGNAKKSLINQKDYTLFVNTL
ncbi:hypothetical protein EDB15_101615 [Vibrio crassostreae]|nr:hypothetical protein EDB15_101615 [Vibrio crassostreae]TCV28070.1 hypothetical protein EDB11_101615 [Vibrio crassostreae]TWD38600.1 hypothetical protein FB442_104264 [Vibrio crassostreae]